MKFSLAFVTFAAASLMACTHSDTPSAPALPQPSDKAATGQVNGQSGDFSVGTYTVNTDPNGKAQYWIYLGQTTCTLGNAANGILVTAPAAAGTYTWPDGKIQFFYSDAEGFHTTMNGNSTIKILSDNGTQITGAVASVNGNSSVDGTFTALNCNAQTTNPPPPIPPTSGPIDPATVQAIPAPALSVVHYAFCSAQGQEAVLIDFEGADLSLGAYGAFKYETRPCDASSAYVSHPEGTVNLTRSGNQIKLDFGPSSVYPDQENTIQVDVTALSQGYGVWDGNSGPCTFLENKGTLGLYDQDPSFQCK